MRKYSCCLLFILYLPCLTYAKLADIPSELLYQGKPIDSLCFFEPEEGSDKNKVNLANCGLNSEKGRSTAGQNDDLIAEGFIGYDYEWPLEDGVKLQGYSYYKPYARIGDSIALLTRNNSGGTGQFSALLLVSRDNNTLSIKTLGGGDRCNNGIEDMTLAGNRLRYSVNMTSGDFLGFDAQAERALKPYEDLEVCAICCKALAVFERNLDDFENEHLVYVDLKAYFQDLKEDEEPFSKYQACFDKLIQGYIKQNKFKLNPAELNGFMQKFKQQCLTNSN
ncbi:hypothetical protein [Legionella londiniensis]|uniref:Secreted protein n=1 Tax=Legionella londiniensis TaxID=45068 RepID=A0A0W0VS21_9GAMM|nr:hypothetical protein [Legionella londiniensis]KTD22935.1 hypothetical protein Llon_0325 [Legionella londiniensis]STX92957.1 Uncharacterised protein [Legionella londiniensis]